MSIIKAACFAAECHKKQVRRYTGESYLNHPLRVALMVESVPHTEAMICAALLHDTVEDTSASLADIEYEFDYDVAQLVEMLTDVSKPEDGNREQRKAIDRAHSAKASPDAKTVKLADLIDNSRSIVDHDPKFAKVYLAEKALLLPVLNEGDATLLGIAVNLLLKGQEKLKEQSR